MPNMVEFSSEDEGKDNLLLLEETRTEEGLEDPGSSSLSEAQEMKAEPVCTKDDSPA